MLKSMTGFSSHSGALGSHSWTWEIRSVNGKSLDVRLRMPEVMMRHERQVRDHVAKAVSRGSVQVGLKLSSDDPSDEDGLDAGKLDQVLATLAQIENQAKDLPLAPMRASDILQIYASTHAAKPEFPEATERQILTDLETALSGLVEMRAAEGNAVEETLTRQIDQMAAHAQLALDSLADRATQQKARFQKAYAELTDVPLDAGRLEQEMALIAVKSDVAEELDRLNAHIGAARALLTVKGPVGRKFDFLMQEFNREVNTLCAKSGSQTLTKIGLDMKVIVDQMREQIQNVE